MQMVVSSVTVSKCCAQMLVEPELPQDNLTDPVHLVFCWAIGRLDPVRVIIPAYHHLQNYLPGSSIALPGVTEEFHDAVATAEERVYGLMPNYPLGIHFVGVMELWIVAQSTVPEFIVDGCASRYSDNHDVLRRCVSNWNERCRIPGGRRSLSATCDITHQ